MIYGQSLNQINSDFHLIIFSSTNSSTRARIVGKSTQIIPVKGGRWPFTYSMRVRRIVRQGYNKNLFAFVVGDPWEGYLAYEIVTIFRKEKFPLQVQVHAEVANPQWYLSSIRNLVKHYLARAAFKNSDAIRAVSSSQKSDLSKKFNILAAKIEVIQPPLNLLPTFRQPDLNRPRSLGFVGRVAKDRGTKLLISLASSLNEVDKEFEIVIVGDGPELAKLGNLLKSKLGQNRVKIHGHLNSDKMTEAWSSIGVLVSLSATESYGRTIREAYAMSIPVWSTPTSGFLELENQMGNLGTSQIKIESDPKDLLQNFNQLLESEMVQTSQQEISQLNQSNIDILCKSWISLFDRDFRAK